jgi:tRNA(Ile)-lysidine synthase
VIEQVRKYTAENGLLRPGDRVAVAVSGGADSVALLRVLVDLRGELGIAISVAHFHHDLAKRFELALDLGSGDAPAHAREHRMSLETAARELRHRWFAAILSNGKVDKIATAHTLDDQAETVLMRVLRGTGPRGLAGISAFHAEKRLVRPLLGVSRKEVEAYLRGLGQPWREDPTNLDPRHTRNRIRHSLVPILEREFNPAIRQTLSEVAEVARAEAEYWNLERTSWLSRFLREGKPSRSGRSTRGSHVWSTDLKELNALPLALRRQVLRAVAEKAGLELEFKHVQGMIALAEKGERNKKLHLPGGLTATCSFRELQIRSGEDVATFEYEFLLSIPGEVEVPALGSRIRVRLVRAGEADVSGYNPALLLERAHLTPALILRNWRAGDKFFPAHTQSPRKIKDLLQAGRVGRELSEPERKSWPVIESGGQIVWMRGFPVPAAYICKGMEAVLIEEIPLDAGVE